jgi:hypothetical protein
MNANMMLDIIKVQLIKRPEYRAKTEEKKPNKGSDTVSISTNVMCLFWDKQFLLQDLKPLQIYSNTEFSHFY